MLRRVAAFCRPLRPVLLLVSFPRSRGPVVAPPHGRGVSATLSGSLPLTSSCPDPHYAAPHSTPTRVTCGGEGNRACAGMRIERGNGFVGCVRSTRGMRAGKWKVYNRCMCRRKGKTLHLSIQERVAGVIVRLHSRVLVHCSRRAGGQNGCVPRNRSRDAG